MISLLVPIVTWIKLDSFLVTMRPPSGNASKNLKTTWNRFPKLVCAICQTVFALCPTFEKLFTGVKVWCKAQKIGVGGKTVYEINPWPMVLAKFKCTRIPKNTKDHLSKKLSEMQIFAWSKAILLVLIASAKNCLFRKSTLKQFYQKKDQDKYFQIYIFLVLQILEFLNCVVGCRSSVYLNH